MDDHRTRHPDGRPEALLYGVAALGMLGALLGRSTDPDHPHFWALTITAILVNAAIVTVCVLRLARPRALPHVHQHLPADGQLLVAPTAVSAPTGSSIIFAGMGRRIAKKPLALFGTLGTMAAIWWFALRPRRMGR